jgi:outer membrane receptor protein involved in Fe transport
MFHFSCRAGLMAALVATSAVIPTARAAASSFQFDPSNPAVPSADARRQDGRGTLLSGRVLTTDGEGVPGLVVTLIRGRDDAAPTAETVTAADGSYQFPGLEPGTWTLVSRSGDGLAEGRATAIVDERPSIRLDIRLLVGLSETVTVTDTRGARLKRETPATIGSVTGHLISEARPSHPSEVMGLVPGVWVNITGGEGHQTAIRQPLTTSPVYLYLEDGVPTRSTGFFNHNALYEINVPASDGIEVTKGPGSALYGSDAIGGVVNVVTRSSLDASGLDVSAEGGEFGWRRVLAGGTWTNGRDGLRGTLNLTQSDGWREATGYDRQSATVRWDRVRGGSMVKGLVSFSNIDQQTAGSSTLSEIDYLTVPRANLTPISFRKVEAYRASLDYQHTSGSTTVSLVPYFRYNSMELLANWTLTFDPTVSTTDNTSWGLLGKVQRDFPRWRTSVLAGADLDFSPGHRVEDIIRPVTSASSLPSGRRIFTDDSLGSRIYDYDVTFFGVSPYAQLELSPTAQMRVSLGLRADHLRYDYDDLLTAPDTPRHRRPADARRSFTHLSPKVGWTWQVTDHANVFASYRHAFRAPAEGQLFRQGSATNTIDLDPVRADNLEAGLRVTPRRGLSFDLSLYQLDKRDDILSFRDPLDGATISVNAGHTRHRGVEAGLDASLTRVVGVQVAYTYARHTYEDWLVDPLAGLDYSGREQETAPRQLGTVSLRLSPTTRVTTGLELTYLGPYWLDAANTTRYGGHALLNLRGQYELADGIRVFGRLLNLTDRTYAESGSYTLQRGREFAPGRPRTLLAGVEVDWRRR